MTAAAALQDGTPASVDAPGQSQPVLQVHVPIQELANYAGVITLASATLAITGVFATTAYLSAWNVPAPVLRLDPLTAALRSETVIYQSILLWVVVFGLDVLVRRLADRPRLRIAALAAAGLVLAVIVVDSVAAALLGPVLTVVGGVALLLAHHRRLLAPRTTVIVFVVLALAAAFQTGAESGRLIRTDPAYRTPLVLTTRSAVGGLEGVETGFGWTYRNLYLVFRDGESVYVARVDRDREVWIIPAANVMSVGLARP